MAYAIGERGVRDRRYPALATVARAWLGLVAALMLAAAPAPAETAAPRLVLETGGHTATIRGLAFLPDGEHLVSAGDDKAIRFWNIRRGRVTATIRGASGPGDEGKIYALALSPDGLWLAVAGAMSRFRPGIDDPIEYGAIRLYDAARGTLAGVLKGHRDTVSSLAFSADGRWLVSGAYDHDAIVWDWRRRAARSVLKGSGQPVYAVAVSADGERVATGGHDQLLRLWSPGEGRLLAAPGQRHTGQIWSIAFAPDGRSFVSSGDDGDIQLWRSEDGQWLRRLGRQPGPVRGLTFSPDGRELVAGFYTPEPRAMPSVVWDVASGVARLQHQGHDDTASAVAVSPDGRLVATGGGLDHAIRVWDRRTGKLEQELVGSGRGVRSVAWHRDGRRLAWGARAAAPEHVIALPLGGRRELGPFDRIDRGRRADWQGETASSGQTQLTVGRGGTHGFQDAVLEVRGAAGDVRIERCSLTGDRHTSRTLTPDGRAVVSGGANGWLERYDIDRLANLRRTPCDRTTSRDLEDRLRFIGHEGDVVALSVSPDGRLLATGSIDQTLRLWSLATRELIASFLFTEDGRWVGWTPQGFYDSSPGGDDMIGWQLDRGADRNADFYTSRQLKAHFYRPDILLAAIDQGSAARAVAAAAAREPARMRFDLAELLQRRLPRFDVVAPKDRSEHSGGYADLTVALHPNHADPVTAFELHVGGRRVEAAPLDRRTGPRGEGLVRFRVPLAEGANEISLFARNAVGNSETRSGRLTLTHAGEGALDKRGTLYLLAIGVDRYDEQASGLRPLRFAGADARAFAAQAAATFSNDHPGGVRSRVLVDGGAAADAPTGANIRAALAEIQSRATDADTVVLLLAGHGANDPLRGYQFLPGDTRRQGDQDTFDPASIIEWRQHLEPFLAGTKGRRIVFLDTCRSSHAVTPTVVKEAADAHIVLFTATTRGDRLEEAGESETLRHGFFTYAVIKGLAGDADADGDRLINLFELGDYLSRKVVKESGGQQAANFDKSLTTGNFILARLDAR